MSQPTKATQSIINEQMIDRLLEEGKQASQYQVKNIIEKARAARGLSPRETAILLQNQSEEIDSLLFQAAREIKEKIYGKRLVLFAPLYLSNYCINNCLYCGYKKQNPGPRRRLSHKEIEEEILLIEELGHKRIALETGEDWENCPMEYILEAMQTIYNTTLKNGAIRRINVNMPATTVENYHKLKEAGIGTYILFQETYHRPTYKKMHPTGPKSDYEYHLTAMNRAMEAGIDDVGIGVLFGLYDFRFEVLALLFHSEYLEQTFGVGPHTISVPRLQQAACTSLNHFPWLVNDKDFKRIVAILRLAVPYTGMILSTRERPGFREEVISLGISQISAGSKTDVGGYKADKRKKFTEQFSLADHRHPNEIIYSLCKEGYLPSYCTACYRTGRTGDRFMKLAKSGRIQNVCLPNALLTFKEYLVDYADEALRNIGEKVINQFLEDIPDSNTREETLQRLQRIEEGERDTYF